MYVVSCQHLHRNPHLASGAERGFTYIGLLILIATMVISLGATSAVWYTTQQREREEELLDIGRQFQRAIGLYYRAGTGNADRLPRQLEDLLKDNRFPGTRRFLRRVYRDPMTGGTEWGLVKTADGYITGVYSLSEKEPIKKANFPQNLQEFEGRMKYSDWVFLFQPPRINRRAPVLPPPNTPAPAPGKKP
jgi:type II secretory pathway pseudopilin PulG